MYVRVHQTQHPSSIKATEYCIYAITNTNRLLRRAIYTVQFARSIAFVQLRRGFKCTCATMKPHLHNPRTTPSLLTMPHTPANFRIRNSVFQLDARHDPLGRTPQPDRSSLCADSRCHYRPHAAAGPSHPAE